MSWLINRLPQFPPLVATAEFAQVLRMFRNLPRRRFLLYREDRMPSAVLSERLLRKGPSCLKDRHGCRRRSVSARHPR